MNPLPALKRCDYEGLNARQQEAFNFQKVSGVLADYGYLTLRLSDDWQGADFIAQHVSGDHFLKIQLKGRLVFDRKYCGRDLLICFPESRQAWFLYPHDSVLEQVLATGMLKGTDSWDEKGLYHFPMVPQKLKPLLAPYRVAACD